MNEEIELKLALLPEHAARLRRHPALRAHKHGEGSTKHLVSVYYDTPAFALLRSKVALRVRQIGQERVQTIKRDAASGKKVHARDEWEQTIEGDRPDLSRVDDPELKRLIGPHDAKGDLNPVFTTEVVRRTWPLRLGKSEIECALDIGEIKADGVSRSLCEVELELKAGSSAGLFELAREINRTVPLRLEPASKAARGYSLVAGTSPVPRRAEPVQLAASMSVREGFAAVARGCIVHIVGNIDSAHHGEDPEGVHQLRVGIRRLRAALATFRGALPEAERAALTVDLRWLQQELGPAREWDVLIEETLRVARQHLNGAAGLDRLQALAEKRRRAAYAKARAALNEPRYTDLLLRLESRLDGQRWNGRRNGVRATTAGAAAMNAPLPDFAAATLRDRLAKAQKLGQKIRKLDQEELHQLRIRIKKLRYATEFFRDLYPDKAARRYIAGLKGLQEVLGEANDAEVGSAHIAALEKAAGKGIERAAGLLLGWTAATLKGDRTRLIGLWREFDQLKPFWNA